MPYRIEYGRVGARTLLPGLKTTEVAKRADRLISQGEIDVQVFGPDGAPCDLRQLKLDLQSVSVKSV